MIENCTIAGATVEFLITGLLPVNRKLRLSLSNQFGDLVGETNASEVVIATHTTPTLGSIYNDITWTETDETVDEFREGFESNLGLNFSEPLFFVAMSITNKHALACG